MALLFTNAKALESANVEAVVVFRTLSIFVTAYGDFKVLKAKALDINSIVSLGLVIAGAIGYVLMDKGALTDTSPHSCWLYLDPYLWIGICEGTLDHQGVADARIVCRKMHERIRCYLTGFVSHAQVLTSRTWDGFSPTAS
jgi:hypothetical protein